MSQAETGRPEPFGQHFGTSPEGIEAIEDEAWLRGHRAGMAQEQGLDNPEAMARRQVEHYGQYIEAQPPEPPEPVEVEPEPAQERPIPPLTPWVKDKERGRLDRTRDSKGTHEDRLFDRRAGYAAARAERRNAKRRGLQRVWAAPDGYLPGETPYKVDRWTPQVASAVIAEAMAETLPEPKRVFTRSEWILKSPDVELAFVELEAEREQEQRLAARAMTGPVFELAAAEAERLLATETPAEFQPETEPDHANVYTLEDHQITKAAQKAAKLREADRKARELALARLSQDRQRRLAA